MKPSKIRAIFALTLVLAMLTLGVRSFAASSPAKVSLDLKFAELAEVFRVLAQVGGSNIVVSPAVEGKITVKLTSVPFEEALDIICSVSDLEYIYMNGTIMVGPKGTVSKLMDKAVVEKVELLNISATDAATKLSFAIPGIAAQPDDKSGTLLLRGNQSDITLAKAFLAKVDAPLPVTKMTVAEEEVIDIIQLANAEAKGVYDAVSKLLKASLAVDARLNAILAGGKITDVKAARSIIEKLDIAKKAEVSTQPVEIRVIQLTNAAANDVKAAASLIIPADRIQSDAKSNTLIIKATPEEHTKVSELVKNIEAATPKTAAVAEVKEKLEVVTLLYAKVKDVAEALAVVLPANKIAVDERTNKLVMLVDTASGAEAMALIKELDVKVADAAVAVVAAPVLRLGYYSPVHAKAQDIEAVVKLVASGAKLQVIESNNSLVAYGTDADHAIITEALKKLDEEALALKNAAVKQPVTGMEVVELKHAKAADVQKALASVLPAENVTIDERTNKVLLKVTPAEKLMAMEIIGAIDVKVEQPVVVAAVPSLEVMNLTYANAADAKKVLDGVLGANKVSVDERTNKVMIMGTPDERALAAEIIQNLDIEMASVSVKPAISSLEVVQLKYAQAADVQKALASVVTPSNITIDPRTNKLLLKVTPEEKLLAMAVINELDVRIETAVAPIEVENLEVVELKYAKVADVKPALDAALGQGKVSVDDRSNKVLMIVTPVKKQLAMSIISAIDVPVATAAVATVEPSLEMVQLKYAVASDVKKVLDGVLGAANVNIDERTNKVIVMVTPAGKAVALDIIGNLDVEVAPKVQPVVALSKGVEALQIVQLKYAPAVEVGKALEAVMSAGKINVDARTNKIIMKVTDEEFSQAKAIISELDIRLEGEAAATTETVQMGFYKLYNVKPSDIEASIKVVAGEAKVQAADQTASITAYGTSMELKMIESLIAKLDVVPTQRGAVAASVVETLEVVQLTNASAADVRASLSVLLPDSKVSINERTNKVMLIVTPELKSQAMTIISALDVPVAQAAVQLSDPVRLGFFQLKYASAKDMEAPVKLVASSAKVQVAERTNSMIVYGTESELALIEEVISKLDVEVKSPEDVSAALAEYKTYKLNNASPTEISSALTILLPASSMLPDDRSGTLIIKAVPEIQKLAADVIATLDVKSVTQASVDADMSVTRVYKLNHAEPADLKAALGEVTTGKVSIDTRTSSLIVTAKASEQAQLVEIIEQLDQELAQVFFEASLYELSDDATKRLGIDWSINKLVFGYNTLSQLATVSLDFDNKIAALADEGKAKLISKQHTFTVDGKAGRMLIGDRIPVIVQNVEQGQVVNTVEYINAGIELSILPKVSYDGSITAEVKPIISSIIGWTPQNYPQIRTRELETIVTVKNGESAIIGGLFSQEEIETITKVPILGDIPLIKELFTKRGTDTKDQEIIIVITAWTIKPGQTTGLKDGIVEIKGPVL